MRIQHILEIKANPDGSQDWRVVTDKGQKVVLSRVTRRMVNSSEIRPDGLTVTLSCRFDSWDDDRGY